ncbi:hypothetical protein [Archangium primigenium]|uniref:hypothetical protein n=1 Tax=[Archangium] primigenium TaxID=2792470 RepID=UPI0019561B14|nr:hypothetical protein [Archangium primigenium]MBM7112411.1 hypothetical protein [Archangium primigenium]
MDIHFNTRVVERLRESAEAVQESQDTNELRDELHGVFSAKQVEDIERRIDSSDLSEFLGDVLEEWSGGDADELLELLEGRLSDVGIDFHYASDDDEEDAVEDD